MGFDEQVVRPQDRELAELEQQFVCVRILRMNDVDLALFQFDYDLTWMGFFLNAAPRVYSRYGGRDAQSDEGRLSVKSLKLTMKRVLAEHRDQSARKVAPARPHEPKRPQELFKVRGKDCLHCHQVWEGLRDRQREQGTFDPASLHVYPLPENVGLELDVHAGNRVAKVRPASPAAKAQVQAGDELRRLGTVNIYSQGDVQWALHHAPPTGKLTVEVLRDGKSTTVDLDLPTGWRPTDQSWRQSIYYEKDLPKK